MVSGSPFAPLVFWNLAQGSKSKKKFIYSSVSAALWRSSCYTTADFSPYQYCLNADKIQSDQNSQND
ncbi:hypothetical protein Tco_1248075 [Tanacetum coccineum]